MINEISGVSQGAVLGPVLFTIQKSLNFSLSLERIHVYMHSEWQQKHTVILVKWLIFFNLFLYYTNCTKLKNLKNGRHVRKQKPLLVLIDFVLFVAVSYDENK